MTTKRPFPKLFERMMDTFHEYQWEKVLASWFNQDRKEKKARLHAVMDLSVELVKIKQVSIFATMHGEAVIEEIIEGDWKAAERWAADMDFASEGPDIAATYAPLWEPFRATLLAYCAEAKRRAAGEAESGN